MHWSVTGEPSFRAVRGFSSIAAAKSEARGTPTQAHGIIHQLPQCRLGSNNRLYAAIPQ
jgi:hypothetical protein